MFILGDNTDAAIEKDQATPRDQYLSQTVLSNTKKTQLVLNKSAVTTLLLFTLQLGYFLINMFEPLVLLKVMQTNHTIQEIFDQCGLIMRKLMDISLHFLFNIYNEYIINKIWHC